MEKKIYNNDSEKMKGAVLYIGNNNSNLVEALQDKGIEALFPLDTNSQIKEQCLYNQEQLYKCTCLLIDDGCQENPTTELLRYSANFVGITIDDYATQFPVLKLRHLIEEHTGVPFVRLIGRQREQSCADARRLFVGIAINTLGMRPKDVVEMMGERYKNTYYDVCKFNDFYSIDANFRRIADNIINGLKKQ